MIGARRRCVYPPGKPPALASIEGLPGPIIDYAFDTTRTAVHLALSGVLDRYPEARIILFHAGGYLQYAAYRYAEFATKTWLHAPPPDSIQRP